MTTTESVSIRPASRRRAGAVSSAVRAQLQSTGPASHVCEDELADCCPEERASERLTAAGRVLAVLEVFDQEHITLSLTEISRRAGLSLSTTHRLVGELQRWGALERGADGRYAIGLRVLELGSLEPQGLRLREVAMPMLGDLHAATGADVNLSVRHGTDVVYVDSIRAREGAPVLTRLGGRWPLHTTATGQVLLAFSPPAFIDRMLEGPLASFTPNTVVDPAEIRRTLAQVRQTGAAIVKDSITIGATAIAVAVRGQQDRPIAAVGVTIRTGTASPHLVLPSLFAAATDISRALGAGRRPARTA